jgi:hypothetical protein
MPDLHWLDLADTKVTDTGLLDLGGVSTLRGLDVRHTRVTAKGIANLKKKLPKLEVKH